jgi:hypothetical protein
MRDLAPEQIQLLSAKPVKNLLPESVFPSDLFRTSNGTSVLGSVYYTDYSVQYGDNSIAVALDMLVPADLELSLFGLDYVTFGIGKEGFVPFALHVVWTNDHLNVMLDNIELNIRFSRDLLLPAEIDQSIPPEDPRYPKYKIKGDEESTEKTRLSVTGSLYLDKDFDIKAEGFDEFKLGPVKLPNLNSVYLFLEGMKLDLSRASSIPEVLGAGFNEDFQGVYIGNLTAVFQDDLEFLPAITAENFAIGTGGISGKITATFDLKYDQDVAADDPNETVFKGDARGRLWGAHIGLRKFEIEFRANEVVQSEITGQMLLPFFEKPVEIQLSLDLKGNISIGLKGTDGGVLAELTREDILSMKINSFAFSKQGKEIAFALGGSIKPLFGGGIEIPEFGVNSLIVSRDLEEKKWGVRIEGGWIDFPKALSFTAAGFQGELKKVGFGKLDLDGTRKDFVGFSGSISFVSGFALAAEFDDLQIFYSPIDITLKRARLALAIPGAISLIGEVSKQDDGFGGMIDVSIIPTQMRILGGAEFGHSQGFSYMQLLMALEMPPPGIMLGSTPISILGFEGKYAMNMVPSMDPGWEWAIASPKGIMPPSKMVPEKGGKMLGAGLKLATTDGTLLAINALFALILPGPVVMIEGRGFVLKNVFGGGNPAEPPFYALLVIDGKEHFLSANLSVNADLAKGIIKVSGTVASFFDFENLNNWYIKLGQKEPRDKRIQALAFKVFQATAYFEVYTGPHLIFGADIKVEEKVNFKVGYARLLIYIGGGVELSWKPQLAAGSLEFFAEIAIKVCGFGAGLSAFGEVDAKCPYPRRLHLEAGYEFFFNLPWPLPDLKGKGKIEKTWKDGKSLVCDFEPLVSEVCLDSEVPGFRPQKLLPDNPTPATLADVQPVPLDARPTITFAYPMNDDTNLALAGNASNGPILQKIGDNEYWFGLKEVTLKSFSLPEDPGEFEEKLKEPIPPPDGPAWKDVGIPYGVWVMDNSATGYVAATTLRLFSNTPFTQFRQTLFSGGLKQDYGLALESFDAGWLGGFADETAIFDSDSFMSQLEVGTESSAVNLAASVEDQLPDYPLGKPEMEWRYIGFADVPIQFREKHLDINTMVALSAAPRGSYFDVLDLHFLPPAGPQPDVHNVPTLVRGVYFERGISVEFSVPVSECEFYLYPVTRKSGTADDYPEDWPDDGPPDGGGGFPEGACEKIKLILEELKPMIQEDLATKILKDLIALVELCCKKQPANENDQRVQKSKCCAGVQRYVQELAKATSDKKAQMKLVELKSLLDKTCVPLKDFLTFDFEPTPAVLQQYPPRIGTSRQDKNGSKGLPHSETREVVGNLYKICIKADGKAFNHVEITNTLAGQGLFLIAIGYLLDVNWKIDVDKTNDGIGEAWSGEGGAEVVLSPRSCYRLTIKTATQCSPINQPEKEHVFYFRTDGPPAKAIAQYIAWTVPGALEYPHFRNYDVAIRFRTNYVDQFYKKAPVQLDIKSANGKIMSGEIGKTLSWTDEAVHLLRPEEQAYIDVLNSSGVIRPIDPEAIPGDKSLTMHFGSEQLLEADQNHNAILKLAASSRYKIVMATLAGANQYFAQHLAMTVTDIPDLNSASIGNQKLISSSEDFKSVSVQAEPEQSLYEFTFRTSRYGSFTDMFSALSNGRAQIQSIAAENPDSLPRDLNALASICEQVWRPIQTELWEKRLLIQLRLAKEEDLLAITDRKAGEGAKLDERFGKVLSRHFPELATAMMQRLPQNVEMYFSPQCIFIQLPEPVEFKRISIKYEAFDVLAACSSDETRWLIFPAASNNSFTTSGKLALTYHLDMGGNYPRLRYGGLSQEEVKVSLGGQKKQDVEKQVILRCF